MKKARYNLKNHYITSIFNLYYLLKRHSRKNIIGKDYKAVRYLKNVIWYDFIRSKIYNYNIINVK